MTIKGRSLEVLFFLLVLFLPTQFGKHFWPDFAFISGLRIDYLSPTLYVTDILVLLFIFVSFLQFGKKIFPPKKILLVYLFLAIGIFLSKNPLSGWYMLLKFSEYLLLGFCLVNYFSFARSKKVFWFPLSIAILFESFLGMWQFFLQRSVGGIFYFFGERSFSPETPGIANATLGGQLLLRPYATFSHPNVFAGFLVIAMILIVFFASQIKNTKEKLFLDLIIGLGTIALLLTLSRVAILLWTFFLGFFLIKKIGFSKKLGVFLVGIIAIILVLLPFLRLRFFDAQGFSESTTQRIDLLYAAIRMFVTHPLFGIGFANFFNELSPLLASKSGVLLIQPVHNIFLLVLAETGIIGIGLFLWLFYLCFLRLKILNKNTNRSQKTPLSALFFLFFAVIILGQFDHYFLTLQQGQLLLTIVFSIIFSLPTKQAKHGTIMV